MLLAIIINADWFQPIRNIKEENLQAMNGIVVALQPPTILQIEKSLDDEAEDALLDGKVVRTEPIEVIQPAGKKPTLGEIGFGPANSMYMQRTVETKKFSLCFLFQYNLPQFFLYQELAHHHHHPHPRWNTLFLQLVILYFIKNSAVFSYSSTKTFKSKFCF